MKYQVIKENVETGEREPRFRGTYPDALRYVNSAQRHEIGRGRAVVALTAGKLEYQCNGVAFRVYIVEAQS